MSPAARRIPCSPLPKALWGWLAVLALLVRLALPALHTHEHGHVHAHGGSVCAATPAATVCDCGHEHAGDDDRRGDTGREPRARESCGSPHACAACELESFAPVDRSGPSPAATLWTQVVVVGLRTASVAADAAVPAGDAAPRAPPHVRMPRSAA